MLREPEPQQANYTPLHRGIFLGVCPVSYNALCTGRQTLLQALSRMIHKVSTASTPRAHGSGPRS
jgi:hypothetical protein